MPTTALQAHFDGEHIVLDEDFGLPVNARLLVTVLPEPAGAETESEATWLRAMASSDAFAFLADPTEDIYGVEDGEAFDHAL